MSDLVKDNDLRNASGGADSIQTFSFYKGQVYLPTSGKVYELIINEDYIDVPANTQISVTRKSANSQNVTSYTCSYILQNYVLSK